VRIDLGWKPRPWQRAVLRQLKRFSVIVVHRQAGKTELAIKKLIDAALRSRSGTALYGYITPHRNQGKGIVWERLKADARQIPGTVINEGELSVTFAHGARIRLFGADNPDSLRGLVFDGLVLDEVAQMALALWGEVLRPTLAAREGWALFIGTPKGINLFSTLYYKALDDPTWFAARYDCNQTGALRPDAITKLQRELTDAQFRQELLCDFAAVSDNVLIPLDVAVEASRRTVQPRHYDFASKILGVDVAWQGGDRSVICARQGLACLQFVIKRAIPEKAFAACVASAMLNWQPDAVFVDTTGGYGGEVVSRLGDAGHHVTGVCFAWKASNERFANMRAEMYFKTAEWLKTGSIPPIPELLSELCALTFSNDNAANRLTLESKDALRARLGCSPDLADALALTFAFPVAARTFGEQHRGVGKTLHDGDPWAEARR